MIKKTIQFNDLDGDPVVEDYWFHLSKAELVELETSVGSGLSTQYQRIIEKADPGMIIRTFKQLMLSSYGVRDDINNKRFKKSQELREAFEQTDAYSVLFMELISDMKAMLEFVKGIMPAGMADEAELNALARRADIAVVPDRPAAINIEKSNAEQSTRDLNAMTLDELRAALASAKQTTEK